MDLKKKVSKNALYLSEIYRYFFFQNTRSSNRVVLRVVSCPPVVDVVVSRPDVKYQLGFSVQNGTVSSDRCFRKLGPL